MKKSLKRVIAFLLTAAMVLSCLPVSALAAVGDVPQDSSPVGKVHVKIEDTVPTPEGESYAAPRGVMLESEVDIYSSDSAMDAVARACAEKGLETTISGGSYISSIDGLGEFDRGAKSGWMVTLNDWFTDQGINAYTVANGGLTDGDLITVTYTLNYGADVGSGWDNNDKSLKALTTDAGDLSPAFDASVKDYTLKLPKGTESVVVTPTAANKNYQVRASADGTEYKRTQAIPVVNGTVIKVECGNPSWPSMNGTVGDAQIYTLTVSMENQAPRLAEGVASPVEVKVGKDAAYNVDLTTIFTDPDGDSLSHYVSIDGAEPVFANPSYTITPDKDTKLVFTANDGTVTSEESYEVNIVKTDNTAPVFKSGVTAYEEKTKETYIGGGSSTYSYFTVSDYFTDPEGDSLTYYVSVNGGEWTKLDRNSYSMTDAYGTIILRFKASDGEFESPVHTVSYTVSQLPQLSIGCVANDRLTGGEGYSNFYYLLDPNGDNTLQMTSKVTPEGQPQTVTWELDLGKEYADIDANGKITFKDDIAKSAYIRVKATNAKGTTANKVIMFYNGGPKLNETEKTLTLKEDGKDQETVKISMADSSFSNMVVVSSSDESVATVTTSSSDIYVTPHRPGVAEIKVAANWNENYYSILKVEVKGVTVETADPNASKIMTLKKGETTTLALKAYGESEDTQFTWSSSDESVAVVDDNGVVTALKNGPVLITAQAKEESGILGKLKEAIAPAKGAIQLQVQGEGVPYLEDFQLGSYNSFGWSKNNSDFVAAQTEYTLNYAPTGFMVNYNWTTTPVFDSEKYDLKVQYTDYSGKAKEAKVLSGQASTLSNILAPGSVDITYVLSDKTDADNVTTYHFKVNTAGTATNTISRLNLYPNEDGLTAAAQPTYEGKAEGTLFQIKDDGSYGYNTFNTNISNYKAFVFDGTDKITLNPTFGNVYERVQVLVDGEVNQELKSATLSAPITLNASGKTEVKILVVSSARYLEKVAAGEDPYAEPERTYTISVEKVTPTAGNMMITSATLDKGSFVAPGYNKKAASNVAMVDYGTEDLNMTFTVPNGYKVYKESASDSNEITGTAGDTETTYVLGINIADLKKTNNMRTIVLKDEAENITYKYSFTFYVKGDDALIPSEVVEYLCLGSQYTNSLGYGGYPEKTLTGLTSTGGNTGGSILSLGNFGGHIVYKFDTPVTDDPSNPSGVDFIVAGNSFGGASASEPGNVEVSQDGVNWYTLAGSVHYDDEADWNYTMTYTNDGGASSWTASDGTSGTNYRYPLASSYPLFSWNAENKQQMTVSGLRIVNNAKDPYGSASAAYPDFGYVDTHKNGNYGEATNPYLGEANVKDGMFDLAWAVDSEGNPVDIDSVSYVRVSTASSIYAGAIGEKSTEVQYISRTANKADTAVGETAAPEKITVDGSVLNLTEGQKSYEAAVHESFDVKVEASADANVYINGKRTAERTFDSVPAHGKIRIIVQEGDKEPAIYVVTLKDFTTDGAKQVADMITALPEISALDITDKDAVNAAKTAFDSLNEEQKALVAQELQTKLTAAVDKMAAMEKAVAQIILKIQAMPEADELNLGYETYVADTKALYDGLTDNQKAALGQENSDKLAACVAKIAELKKAEDDKNAAAAVDALIERLPAADRLILEDKADVEAARAAYNALTDDQKALVEDLKTLEAAEGRIAELEAEAADKAAAQTAIDKIDALAKPEDMTLADKAAVEGARAAYDALTDAQKAYVSNLDALKAAEDRIADLEAEAADQAVAQSVIDMIENLGAITGLDQKTEVQAARNAYDKLTDSQKAYVSGDVLKVLSDAEARIDALEAEAADKAAAQSVVDAIDALTAPEAMTLADKASVEAARAAYDALTDAQKAYVANLEVLEAAEARIVEIEADLEDQAVAQSVIDMIEDLGDITSLDQKTAVQAARNAYDKLTDSQKAYVSENVLKVLTDAETKISELEKVQEEAGKPEQKPAEKPTAGNGEGQGNSQTEAAQKGTNVGTGIVGEQNALAAAAVMAVLAAFGGAVFIRKRREDR
ncbi:MAG: Ig-like domain-containing protein [Eubacterium sp.]|nr:Ig-like domain-containing protein [Eubacterium sp.]